MYRVTMWHTVMSMPKTRWVRRCVGLWYKKGVADPLRFAPACNWVARVCDDAYHLNLSVLFVNKAGHCDDGEEFLQSFSSKRWVGAIKQKSYEAAVMQWKLDILGGLLISKHGQQTVLPGVPHLKHHYGALIQHMNLAVPDPRDAPRICQYLYSEQNKRKRQFYTMLRLPATARS